MTQVRTRTAQRDSYICYSCSNLFEGEPQSFKVLLYDYEAGTLATELEWSESFGCHDDPPCRIEDDEWVKVREGHDYHECGECGSLYSDSDQSDAIACCT